MRRLLIFLLLSLCLPALGQAVELYRVLGDQCKGELGYIFQVDQKQIHLLTLEGEAKSVEREGIKAILVYNLLQNPIQRINLQGKLLEEIRQIRLAGDDGPALVGWPIKFVEDFVVFFDLDGDSSLIKIEQILQIKAPDDLQPGPLEVPKSKPVAFALGRNLPQCPETNPSEAIHPTQVINDPIRVNNFLQGYSRGFLRLDRFQYRTRYYARPHVFDQDTLIGLSLMPQNHFEELPFFLPFSFHWSAGSPYSHQTRTVFGSQMVEILPMVEPKFAIRADLKSHFFNGSFVGNLFSLSAGGHYLIQDRLLFSDYFLDRVKEGYAWEESWNYLALSGFDYGDWSLSLGTYYPLLGVLGGGYFREILPVRASPILRLQYYHENKIFRFSATSLNFSSQDPTERQIRVIESDELTQQTGLYDPAFLLDQLQSFTVSNQTARLAVHYDWSNHSSGTIDLLTIRGDYQENLGGEDHRIRTNQMIWSLTYRQKFSSYVALFGRVNYFRRQYLYDEADLARQDDFSANSLIGGIQFVL